MDLIKKDEGHEHPMRDPAAAAKLLAELRDADPIRALDDLTAWVDEAEATEGGDETGRSEILSLVQQSGDPHVSALLAQFFTKVPDTPAGREPAWHALSAYLAALTGALCASAVHLLKDASTNPSLQPAAAAVAARALHSCRGLVKACLMRYLGVAPKLWHMVYVVHRAAEAARCAELTVRMHATRKTMTSVNQELLRLLMLQSSAPEMLAPGQIEVADWAVEQLGADFILRPHGAADNPFCFDPASESPPRRAAADQPEPAMRYFGAGMAHDALERIYRQMAVASTTQIRTFGGQVAAHAQLSAVEHLLAFWGPASPYSPPVRSAATGGLRVVHGFDPIWQQISRGRSGTNELALMEDGDVAAQPPETWTLQDTGGDELGAHIPQRSAAWARCGELVGVSTDSDGEWWPGLIRSMHAHPDLAVDTAIYVMSRHPQALQLRAVKELGEEDAFSDESARQFGFRSLRAIILSDGTTAPQRANLLLPPESWKEGRVFEVMGEQTSRCLRAVRLLRRGDDYVRAAFEWMARA